MSEHVGLVYQISKKLPGSAISDAVGFSVVNPGDDTGGDGMSDIME